MTRIRLVQTANRRYAEKTPIPTSRPTGLRTKETKRMLIYEDMSRIRMREDQRVAAEQRTANRMLAIRRWERLAGWAAKRAAKVRDS